VVGSDPLSNAQVVRDVLAGTSGPVRDIVLLNAAAALVADAKPTPNELLPAFADQLGRARDAVDSGAAQAKLLEWVDATQAAA
jgi:anthranilate phosphoribosyltransferase